ncbi:MAG: SufD family Fe-S cluster assembly protein [Rhodobacteraceae bacterium]|nr:SufD family Fe-S cluster assembly protein [Paracoccaceae bacterium]
MPAPLAKPDATAERLAGINLPEGSAWASEARKSALARLAAMGLPGRRDEYWKWTDPTTLVAEDVTPAALLKEAEAPLFVGVECIRLVFVDGVFDAALSDDPAAAGLEIDRLQEAQHRDIHWVRDIYAVLETKGQKPVSRPLAAWNSAIAGDGVLIRATARVARPVHIDYRRRDPAADAVLHHVIRVEAGAELTVLESGAGAARFNQCMEVDVAAGGQFHHVRAQGRDHERRAVAHLFARVGAGALFKSFTLTANGRLTRNEAVIDITGEGAVAHIAGACVGDGDFHHDDTVYVTHDAVGCESRQVFKNVLRHGATGVFQGKILVKQAAQKTDGYQISQALLLDEASQFLAKPELEIYADDVKCSHGSTSGAIDETALFYLRSRGVPREEAAAMLVLSFVADAIAEIEDPALAADISDRLEAWLARRKGQ